MKRTKVVITAVALLLTLVTQAVSAQSDSAVFINGDFITGTVESMDRGIIVFSTDYSDNDFTIEWEKVKWIYTISTFMVAVEDGDEYFARIETSSDKMIRIIPVEDGEEPLVVEHDRIVHLNSISSKFMDRVSANIDAGFSLTKANNIKQFSVRGALGYKATIWSTDISYNTNRSDQDKVDPTERNEGAYNLRFNLTNRLYTIATISFLSNTEQQLDLRANTQLGLGAYIVRTNWAYWGGKIGVNRNNESYVDPTNDRDSWEGYVGTEVDLYDIGDLSLKTVLMVYPGFTENGRIRTDFNFDVKYDFPLDFYANMGFSLNYDNQPVPDTNSLDYVFQVGLGWEW